MNFDFCSVVDVQSFNRQLPTFSTSTKPTLVEVQQFIIEVSSYLRSIISQAGYDIDNLHEVSGTAPSAITAGSNVVVPLGSGEGDAFTAYSKLKIEGLVSGVVKLEFQVLASKSGDSLTIAVVSNSYSADAVIKEANDAMQIIRHICVLGVSLNIEKSIFSGSDPNISNRYEEIRDQYFGDKKNQSGIWAIQNVEDFLRGATQTGEAAERATLQSYGSEHEGDTDVKPVIEKDMDF